MGFSWILSLCAGLALFLYGMKIMGAGLEKSAGNRMNSIIEKLTGNVFKALMIGTLVTALIQSSNATIVMVVGFINAGIMTLSQSVGVMLGANIGTTMTAILISLEDINANALWVLNIFKPSFLAPVAAFVGVILLFFAGKKKYIYFGEILAGFGILFLGMDMMSEAMSFLQGSPTFETILAGLSNPVLGVLVGFLLTVIIQSSSASIGILQAASATGMIKFSTSAALILGMNVGACVTAVLSSFSANREAKKAAWLNVEFKTVGMLIFVIVLYAFGLGGRLPVWSMNSTKSNIAVFHIIFNVVNSVFMIPISKPLMKLVDRLVPRSESDNKQTSLELRLLNTPALALEQVKRELFKMMNCALQSVVTGYKMLTGEMSPSEDELDELEEKIDIYEAEITKYLVKLSGEPLTREENIEASAIFHVITDVERIGDHAYNITGAVSKLHGKEASFSPEGKESLLKMYTAVNKMVAKTLDAFENNDADEAVSLQAIEDVVDVLKAQLKEEHLERLRRSECSFDMGVLYLDIITNLERISDHCSNIGVATEQISAKRKHVIDPHEHLKNIHDNPTKEFQKTYNKYYDRYTK